MNEHDFEHHMPKNIDKRSGDRQSIRDKFVSDAAFLRESSGISPENLRKPNWEEAARRGAAAQYGTNEAALIMGEVAQQRQAASKTRVSQRVAQAISAGRVKRGEGAELAADKPRLYPLKRKPRPSARRSNTAHRQSLAKRKQAERVSTKVRAFALRVARDAAREADQAEALADKMLKEHGIRHHFRPLPKVAFFSARMAGEDRNGSLAIQALMSINMPLDRISLVLAAAYRPAGYSARRNVCSGMRSSQRRSVFDGRVFGRRQTQSGEQIDRPLWLDAARVAGHPGAIRVIQCAVFLWLAKTRTRRNGYSHCVRGFGLGVFTAICGVGKDAISGQTRGLPGALLALKQAGFIDYGQPPAERVGEIDRGPSGHAYNLYWFPQSVAEMELAALLREAAIIGRQPLIERLSREPALINQRCLPPPPEITDADIPF